ncbi:hypothetical protein GCM10011571_20440 [Marinithermofilum abyssi]|uniref:Uncharacterized protein n=1 Tax=Marinithermofilum abyssi TaxID=1571185 RepID=A0A8J2VHY0_9BACL|nr:hypothetical protein [Marinithermofilum abyssi]GGE18475.1 hypothetical protein GCM10011571_20440 [Marinithermofilum abyssi]
MIRSLKYGIAVCLLPLLFLGWIGIPSGADAHEHEEHPTLSAKDVTTANRDVQLKLNIRPNSPRVGQITNLSGELRNTRSQKALGPAIVKIKVIHTEDGRPMLNVSQLTDQGVFRLKYHFFDGAPQKVHVTVMPLSKGPKAFQPLEHTFTLGVTPVQPPNSVMVKTLTFLLFLALVGFIAGFWLGKRPGTGKAKAT